jgi:energy-coupling factor transporter transmembrane protein EcfT
VEFGLLRKHRVPPITWTILVFLLLIALGVTPVRYKGEVNLIFLSLRLFFTLVVAVVGIRAYWRYWHYGESGPTLRKSLLYRWRKWMLDEED